MMPVQAADPLLSTKGGLPPGPRTGTDPHPEIGGMSEIRDGPGSRISMRDPQGMTSRTQGRGNRRRSTRRRRRGTAGSMAGLERPGQALLRMSPWTWGRLSPQAGGQGDLNLPGTLAELFPCPQPVQSRSHVESGRCCHPWPSLQSTCLMHF